MTTPVGTSEAPPRPAKTPSPPMPAVPKPRSRAPHSPSPDFPSASPAPEKNPPAEDRPDPPSEAVPLPDGDPFEPGRSSASGDRGGLRTVREGLPRRGDLPVLGKVRSSRPIRLAAWLLGTALCGTIVLMAFAPWQQTVRGSGRVINYDPAVRPQVLQSPIEGRVMRLGEGVREMAQVQKGDVIAELADLDPQRLDRLQLQLQNAEQTTLATETALRAAEGELSQAEQAVTQYELNVASFEAARDQALASAGAGIEAARQALRAAEQTLVDRQAALDQAEPDYRRQKQLYDEKLSSQLKFQTAELKYRSAQANVRKAEADVAAAEKMVEAKSRDRDEKKATATTRVQSAIASLRAAEATIESKRAGVAKAQQSVQSARNAEETLRSSVVRQENQRVVAPFDGVLTDVYADGGSNVLSQGSPIARIVPTSGDRVVEILLDGNDAPLVSPGKHVRLQFEGWPAIQFTGWPSVAVGTFGGEVLSVDASDNGQGQFRILVKEVSGVDEESGLVEEPWPTGNYLRPGVRANAWVLLETVDLWFEVWRNLNGFPPVVDMEGSTKRPKVPKLPK